ncbi:MAG: hypothetical protein HXS40_00485 [Theionarchaea archaeon]|nr:hypothetical protein [Theionarchaea archaeon]
MELKSLPESITAVENTQVVIKLMKDISVQKLATMSHGAGKIHSCMRQNVKGFMEQGASPL